MLTLNLSPGSATATAISARPVKKSNIKIGMLPYMYLVILNQFYLQTTANYNQILKIEKI